MKKFLVIVVVLGMVAGACGNSDEGDGGPAASTVIDGDTQPGGGDTDTGGGGGDQDGGTDGNPPDDDAAAIVGNPDLDLDDLPSDVAGALDDIDDIVSIGDCEAAGLMATAPAGWQCRVLDQAIGGMDGFTMFTEGNQLNITIGTPSPFGPPCQVLNVCDTVEPIALSDNFPDTKVLDLAGTVTIFGAHATVDAELVITNLSALTPDELLLVMTVLDSVEPS